MKPLLKSFLKRLLLIVIPLVALYFYAQMAFKHNMEREHPTDVGLGIAFLATGLLLVLLLIFLFDIFKKLKVKNYNIVKIDAFFLLFLSAPIAYLICQITSRDCFCTAVINIGDSIF
ncbi:hypothetical protein [Soonwooa sp.]|uniref:hypothetical protein n=1 Tax=Soonwooa sp. TaxID=1938592 RepID=UPI0026358672|nr:hypothetical protein [Soonwooa sp.]